MLTQEDLNAISELMDTKFEKRFDSIDQRLEVVDQRLEVVDQRLDRVESNMYLLSEKVDGMNETLQEVRVVTNRLLEWSDEVGAEIGVKI